MVEVVIAVVLALVLTILIVRVGRICFPRYLWPWYGLSAVLSGAVGVLVQKVVPLWLILPEEKRTLASGLSLFQQTGQLWLAPQTGEQWVVGVMVVSLVCSLLLGMLQRAFRTVVGGVVVGAILFGFGCLMFQKMLTGSMYFMPNQTTFSKVAYVVGPTLVLFLPWLGLWQWYRRVTPIGINAASVPQDRHLESLVHLLSVLALMLSGTLLLATSGTLSLALQLMVFSMVPLAWMIEAWLPHRGQSWPLPVFAASTLAGWASATAGLWVVLGHLFAEVSLVLGLLYAVSLWWVPWMWPSAKASAMQKWGLAILAAAPALIAAGIAAVKMVAAHG